MFTTFNTVRKQKSYIASILDFMCKHVSPLAILAKKQLQFSSEMLIILLCFVLVFYWIDK